MNILYCGDSKIEDGLIISVLSLLKNNREELHIYVISMSMTYNNREFYSVSAKTITYLENRLKEKNNNNSITLLDATEYFNEEMPIANMDTRFTPFCMLRLFTDKFPEIPDKILYLDNDVICRKSIGELYNQSIDRHEIIGVLDYYGSWFFYNEFPKKDYLNSGVLLMNMKLIKQTKLLQNSRKMCREKQMFMPDQSALNKLAKTKKAMPRRFNEQRLLHEDTVLQHFTTSFRFFPLIRKLTIKPWQVDKVHSELKLFEYDDILNEYINYVSSTKGC